MLNSVVIMGRMVHTPELKTTTSGVSVCSFTLAVDRDFKGGGDKETDFIDCVAWRGTAEFVAKYMKKGAMAVAVGSLQSRKWQDKNGNNRTSWEVQTNTVYFGEKKQDGDKHGVDVSAYDFTEIDESKNGDEELPF